MRKSSKFIVVAGALAALAVPSVASANVAVDHGVGHVDKGDVQTALKWNNSDFDAKSVAFTAGVTKTYDNVLTCKADAGDKAGLVEHVKSITKGTSDIKASPVLSSNGKQITGWNLTGANGSVPGSNDLMAVMQRSFTLCLPDKPLSEMTPAEMSRQALWTIDNTGTVTLDGGLKVNGVDLPNTPVAIPTV